MNGGTIHSSTTKFFFISFQSLASCPCTTANYSSFWIKIVGIMGARKKDAFGSTVVLSFFSSHIENLSYVFKRPGLSIDMLKLIFRFCKSILFRMLYCTDSCHIHQKIHWILRKHLWTTRFIDQQKKSKNAYNDQNN